MTKQYEVRIVTDMEERVKQVEQNLFRALKIYGIIPNRPISYKVGNIVRQDITLAQEIAENSGKDVILIAMGPTTGMHGVGEDELSTKYKNVRLYEYDTGEPIFPKMALALLMLLSQDNEFIENSDCDDSDEMALMRMLYNTKNNMM